MAILSKEDFLNAIKVRVGEDNSDDAMKFIEDMTDTYNSFTAEKETDGEDWKAKYDELDKTWREKYKARFFAGTNEQSSKETNANSVKEEQETDVKEDGENVTFDDLFEDKEG